MFLAAFWMLAAWGWEDYFRPPNAACVPQTPANPKSRRFDFYPSFDILEGRIVPVAHFSISSPINGGDVTAGDTAILTIAIDNAGDGNTHSVQYKTWDGSSTGDGVYYQPTVGTFTYNSTTSLSNLMEIDIPTYTSPWGGLWSYSPYNFSLQLQNAPLPILSLGLHQFTSILILH